MKDKCQIWINNLAPGLSGKVSGGKGSYVCANHFVDGEPTNENPHPTLFLSLLQTKFRESPKKRKTLERAGTSDANNHSDDSNTHEFTAEAALDTAANDDCNMDVVFRYRTLVITNRGFRLGSRNCEARSHFKTSIQSGNGNCVYRVT